MYQFLFPPKNDIESAIDRYFLNQNVTNLVSSFFSENKKKRTFEEHLSKKYLTSDAMSTPEKIFRGIATGRGPAKSLIDLIR